MDASRKECGGKKNGEENPAAHENSQTDMPMVEEGTSATDMGESEPPQSPKLSGKHSPDEDSQAISSEDGLPPKRPKVAPNNSSESSELGATPRQLLQHVSESSSELSTIPRPGEISPAEAHMKPQTEQWLEKTKIVDIIGEAVYQVKWVDHLGQCCPIIMQNENGPCPLIGVINVLFLRNKLRLPDGTCAISPDELVAKVHQAITDTMVKDGEDHNPNHLQNVQDAIALLPQLKTGLNVNVKFTSVKNFEYTPECLIFDILSIHLYHGWLLDPHATEIVSAIGSQSYNQLVEAIIEKKTAKDPDKVAEALVAENFLEATASQLTVYGLCELNSTLKKGEMAILFRNNHFIVLYKHEDILCQLVTDQGFLDEPQVVWETLSTINGDEMFLNGSFKSAIPKGQGVSLSSLQVSEEQQISRDFLVALSLQDEQNKRQDKEFGWDAYGNALGAIGMTSDEVLAHQLYVEEQRMAQATASGSQTPVEGVAEIQQVSSSSSQSRHQSTSKDQDEPSKSRDWKCTIA